LKEFKKFFKNPFNLIALILFLIILVIGFFPDLFTSYDPYSMNVEKILLPPSTKHLFGTDQFGRDLFTRVIYGIKESITIAFLAILIATTIGSTIGIISGYFGKTFDLVIMRLIDVFFAFPPLILALFVVALFGSSKINLILSIGVVYTPIFARTIRSVVLSVKTNNYVLAAKALGRREFEIILFHIIPNILPMIFVTFTLNFSTALLTEASLGFLGLGVPPPEPSLGGLVGEGRNFLLSAPWIMLYPGFIVALIVISINLIGDGLQDVVNPKK